MKLPTEKEINPYPGDLDGDYAVKNWLNVSIEGGAKNLAENSLHYGEDFSYMGKVAFNYYLKSAIIYAESPESVEDSDFASSFVNRLEFRLKYDREIIEFSKSNCLKLLDSLNKNIKKYEIDEAIYGNVGNKIIKTRQAIASI